MANASLYPGTNPNQGLAVIINNSLHPTLNFNALTNALANANYKTCIFENLNTLAALTNMVSQLNFPTLINQRYLQKIKNQNERVRVNDNRREIYSLLLSREKKEELDRNHFMKLCNEMNQYEKPVRGDDDASSSTQNLQDPSLLVIYLGQSLTRDGILLKKDKTFSKISHNHFVDIFHRELVSRIPINVCQIFTFATMHINNPTTYSNDYSFIHYNHKETKTSQKNNNIIAIQLTKYDVSFQTFIQFFANFINTNRKNIKNIETFLKKQNKQFIESYVLKLRTRYKFSRSK